MSIEIRRAHEDDWPAICFADGRAFGTSYTVEEIAKRLPLHDMSRFRIAVDTQPARKGQVVGVAGSYALDVTLPGGATVPMGGVTWVSTATTHRRQGLMRQVVGAVHDDIDDRGESLATLYASEGGIYEHLGYGIASYQRSTVLDRRLTRMRAEFTVASTGVQMLDEDADVTAEIAPLWERFRRTRVGEVSRDGTYHDALAEIRNTGTDGMSAAYYLVHRDGFAVYRMKMDWQGGLPAHTLHLAELAAITPEAHAALWQTLLDVDLIAEIHSRAVAIDDPLPYLLENQRALRTTVLADGVWANLRDVSTAFGARTYRTEDRLVVEADGKRWAIEGGVDGGSCRAVRTRPDLTTSHSGLSSLIYGGVLPSALVAGLRMSARNDDVLRRADLFFPTSLAPNCQTHY
jgi:predicted acetyltransferase